MILDFYHVSALPHGHYNVEAGQKGFKKTCANLTCRSRKWELQL